MPQMIITHVVKTHEEARGYLQILIAKDPDFCYTRLHNVYTVWYDAAHYADFSSAVKVGTVTVE